MKTKSSVVRKKSNFDYYLTYTATVRLLIHLMSNLRSAMSGITGKSKIEAISADKLWEQVEELQSMIDDFAFRDCQIDIDNAKELLSVFYDSIHLDSVEYHDLFIKKTQKIMDDYLKAIKNAAIECGWEE